VLRMPGRGLHRRNSECLSDAVRSDHTGHLPVRNRDARM
jgi:hypothetical protein